MKNKKGITSSQIVRVPKIAIYENSPEARDLDPSLYRIIPSGDIYAELSPVLSGLDSQFTSAYIKEDKSLEGTVLTEPGDIVDLEEVKKISGPTPYYVGNSKKFKITVRVTNSKGLSVKGVNVRKSIV